jgi:hypothetical protein
MTKGDIETYHKDGVRKNRAQGGQRASNTAETKAEAQAAGRPIAIDRGVEHVIKKLDGTIGEYSTYTRRHHVETPCTRWTFMSLKASTTPRLLPKVA